MAAGGNAPKMDKSALSTEYTVRRGEDLSVMIPVTAEFNNSLTATLTVDGTSVKDDDEHVSIRIEHDTIFILLKEVDASAAGLYRLRAENTNGDTSASFTVRVIGTYNS